MIVDALSLPFYILKLTFFNFDYDLQDIYFIRFKIVAPFDIVKRDLVEGSTRYKEKEGGI